MKSFHEYNYEKLFFEACEILESLGQDPEMILAEDAQLDEIFNSLWHGAKSLISPTEKYKQARSKIDGLQKNVGWGKGWRNWRDTVRLMNAQNKDSAAQGLDAQGSQRVADLAKLQQQYKASGIPENEWPDEVRRFDPANPNASKTYGSFTPNVNQDKMMDVFKRERLNRHAQDVYSKTGSWWRGDKDLNVPYSPGHQSDKFHNFATPNDNKDHGSPEAPMSMAARQLPELTPDQIHKKLSNLKNIKKRFANMGEETPEDIKRLWTTLLAKYKAHKASGWVPPNKRQSSSGQSIPESPSNSNVSQPRVNVNPDVRIGRGRSKHNYGA